MDLIINDESIVNDRGWRLSNAGLDRSRYDKNPVLLYQHDPDRLIGKCTDLRIEGSRLIGSFEFDTEDDTAQEVYRKMNSGFLKGASPMLYVREITQTEGEPDVVTEWELFEVSVVTLPSNPGALKLCSEYGFPLSKDEEAVYLSAAVKSITTNKKIDMKKENEIPTRVRLSEEVSALVGVDTLEEVTVEALQSLTEEVITLRAAVKEAEERECDALLSGAVRDGKIGEGEVDNFRKLYATDKALCLSILSAMPARASQTVAPAAGAVEVQTNTLSLTAQVKAAEKSNSDRFGGSWDELDRKGRLLELKATDPELFMKKFQERFSK